MKKIIFVALMLLSLSIFRANAQFVRTKPVFGVGVSVGAPGPAPYGGAIWIGPEWTWHGNRYVEVPGYWAKPGHYHGWINGHWKYTRRGYRWVPGHWK